MPSKETLNNILSYLEEGKKESIYSILADIHAADIADILLHINKQEERFSIFLIIPKEKRGEVLVELEESISEDLLEKLNTEEKIYLINQLNSDDATDILSLIDDEQDKESIIQGLGEEQKKAVLELLNYDENSAGGIMSKEYVSVKETLNVNNIIEEIRKAKDEINDIYNVWVVDKRNHLLGRIRLKDLVLAHPERTASEIMTEKFYWVNHHQKQGEVARVFEKYDLVEIPVVNDKNKLIGHITVDDIVDVIEDEAQEDISKLAGTRDEEIKEQSIFKIIQARLPWLIFALFAGICAAMIMQKNSPMLKQFVQLAFFVPVVIAMGGNVGVQSSTIVIRGLATGEINMVDLSHRLLKELQVSIFNGLFASTILFSFVYLIFGQFHLAFVCSFSMIIAVICAGIIGSMIPFLLKRFGIDPALSSGPFITTSNDIIGTFIYFSMAHFLLI